MVIKKTTMATIKSYTDINQSKKLAEILPIESADYHYIAQEEKLYFYPYSLSSDAVKDYDKEIKYIPCWSLAALLVVISNIFKCHLDYNGISFILIVGDFEVSNKNPIDACYELILKLHERKIL